MFNKLAVFALLTLSTVYSADPIKFKGGDVAVSPTIKGKVTIYASPKGKDQPFHSQFLYEKLGKDPKKFTNAEVELYKGDTKVGSLQSDFNTISQECECYWLNATNLVERFPKMTNGDYHIVMEGNGYTVKSGIFSVISGKTGGDDKEEKDDDKDDGDKTKEKETGTKSKTDEQTSTGSSSEKETKATDSSESDTNSKSTFKKESSSSKPATTQSQTSNSLTFSPSFAATALCIFCSYLKL